MEKICPVCGEVFDGSEQQRKCRKCCYVRQPREYVCADCGAAFSSAGYHVKRCPVCAAAEKKRWAMEAAQARAQWDRDSAGIRKLLDENYSKVCEMYRDGCSRKQIERRLGISKTKVQKILVDAQLITYPETELFNAGVPVSEIAARAGKPVRWVQNRIPYYSTPHNATYPSLSATGTRSFRARKRKAEEC